MERDPAFIVAACHAVDISKSRYSNEYYFGTMAQDTIVYKKVYLPVGISGAVNSAVAVLEIPAGTKFGFDWWFTKCRAERANVLAIIKCRGVVYPVEEATSGYDAHFKYVVGEEVKARLDRREMQCGSGIHFFFDVKDAYAW